jgi:hypothetical protein
MRQPEGYATGSPVVCHTGINTNNRPSHIEKRSEETVRRSSGPAISHEVWDLHGFAQLESDQAFCRGTKFSEAEFMQ